MKKRFRGRMLAIAMAAALAATTTLSLPTAGVVAAAEDNAETVVVKSWSEKADYERWYYGDGWEYGYNGKENSDVRYDEEMNALKITVDYSKESESSWSQMAACFYDESMDLTGGNKVELDFLYDSSRLTGGFSVKIYSNGGADDYIAVDTEEAENVSGTISKVHMTIPLSNTLSKTPDLSVCIIGNTTAYTGDLWIRNIKVLKEQTEEEDISVDSTVPVKDETKLSIGDLNIASEITLVDKEAAAGTKAVYAYLKAIGESDSVIYGHQNDTWHKAGSAELTNSDTKDVTGSIAGVVGIDTLSLVGNEYSASRWNTATGESVPETIQGNIQAAAKLSNQVIADGAIVTLSAHMPNFSIVTERADYKDTDPTYAKYDFSGYTPNTLSGDVVNQILPGGQYNEKYNAFLDMVADYAKQVNGTILFRPFHENTGSWFWWGAAFCDPVTYKSVYKYTVEYLRDTKDVHNLLYVYGPGSEAASTAEYEERYPGDEYVDMVGFDMYNNPPAEDNSPWYNSFKAELGIVNEFAKSHNKLIAVTETGSQYSSPAAGDNQTALLKKDNPAKDWYNHILDMVSESDASYFLLWANFGMKDGFYTPYVEYVNEDGTLHGHEFMDYFIDFFNDERSVFAVNQKSVLGAVDGNSITAKAAAEGVTGYITTPISGNRILEAMTLKAKVTGESAKVEFVLHGAADVTLTAVEGGSLYSAELTEEDLGKLGEKVGTIDLVIDGEVKDTVNATFNIEPPVIDPYEIDDFENYHGVDSLLTKAWSTNKATGNTIEISLSNEEGKVFSGDYSMKFSYNETADGWAGATISKEVDWSDCNALQFYTIPDGKNQKVVIQLTANGVVYEAYLNTYEEYAKNVDGEAMLVTIPFSEFCQRDTAGNPKGGLVEDCSKLTSFGLWVNAIGDSEAVIDGMVNGTIYYDKITAVMTDKTEAVFEKINQEPADPDDPEEPDNPGNPNKPEEPKNPDKTDKTDGTSNGKRPDDKTNKAPKTGDELNPALFAGIIIVSLSIIAAAAWQLMKKRRREL